MKNILILVLTLGQFTAFGQTNVPALITSNQTWTSSGSPFLISQNTILESGVQLKIMPGVTVKSTVPDLTLFVDGELQALGGPSTGQIQIDSLEIKFSSTSSSYNSGSGTGAYFNWCRFTGVNKSQSGQRTAIKGSGISIKVENSIFVYHDYGIDFGPNGSNWVYVNDCSFKDQDRLAIRCFASKTNGADVRNCTFDRVGGLYFYGMLIFKENVLERIGSFSSIAYNDVQVICNSFKKVSSGIVFTVYRTSEIVNLEFVSNTLDSFTGSKMVEIHWREPNAKTSAVKFQYNNFLTHTTNANKVLISGSNFSPAGFGNMNFKRNYWGTTSMSTISELITDNDDDILIPGKVIYHPILSSKHDGCEISTCEASYYLALDTSTRYNLYVVNNSTGTTANTKYDWSFGDGATSSSKNPVHSYSKFGLFQLCLTISNKADKCQSTICDSIGLDSNGRLLKADGFTISVLNETDIVGMNSLPKANNWGLYPNPTQGDMVVQLNAKSYGMSEVKVLNAFGQQVMVKSFEITQGLNKLNLNLMGSAQGIYFVRVDVDHEVRVFKVMLKN